MTLKRIIPVLLLDDEGLVKTIKFNKKIYLGDPVNTIKIFNDKEVDEIILLDINASKNNKQINYKFLFDLAGECFIPLSYGGGINNIESIAKIITIGYERVSLNSAAVSSPAFIREAAKRFGSSTVIASIDYKRDFWKKFIVYTNSGKIKTKYNPVEIAKIMEDEGAGELMIQSVENDGTYSGYDLEMLHSILDKVKIPVIICSGARDVNNLKEALQMGASGAAAGSLFVFKGKLGAKLINYPSREDLI